MLKFTLRTTVAPAPTGTIGLVGLSGGGLATVDSTGAVTPLAGTGRVTVNTDWSAITSRPTAFPPTAHAHEISDVNGLQSALDTISGGGISDGDKGDVTVSSGGTVWSIDTFAGSAKGLVPSSSGGTVNFLRADGTWAAPSGGGGVSDGDKGDLTVSGSGTVWTLDTVNLSPQTDTFRKITVNGKGLVTATSAVSASDLNATFGTVTQNTFYAGPDGVNSTPVFRNIVAADIPALTTAKLSDFNSAARAQVEAELVAGTNITITPSGSGATRQLTIAASGGGGGVTSVSGTGTVNGLTLTGTVTSSGNITLGGTLSVSGADFASQFANRVLASPDGASGAPAFRKLVLADLPPIAANSILGNNTGSVAVPAALTGTQTTALLDTFTSSLKGVVPASGGGTTNFLRADGTWASPGGGGGSTITSGKTTVNFGAFPGASDAKVTITGQSGILSTSKVKAYLVAEGTADHSADEHWCEQIEVMAGNIVAGTGFDIYAKSTNNLAEPVPLQSLLMRSVGPGQGVNTIRPDIGGGKVPRLYGQFTVAWEWI